MTKDIDSDRSVSVSHGTLIGPKMYRATALGYLCGKPIGEIFEGYGHTMYEADTEAERAAEDFIRTQS